MREEPPEPGPRVVVDARTAGPTDLPTGCAARLEALSVHVLVAEGLGDRLVELTVHLVDEEPMAGLNREHMGSDGPTDVLAFPVDGPVGGADRAAPDAIPVLLGDVVICPEVAGRQAAPGADGLLAEVELLLVHGILHLLGHDHAEPGERSIMEARQAELLDGFRQAVPPSGPVPAEGTVGQ